MKQMMNEEDMALLEHRLTSTQPRASSNLVGRMIDDIDTILTKSNQTVQTSANNCFVSNEINRLQALKKDIIHQAIITNRGMVENLKTIITAEQNKFSLKNRFMESTSTWQKIVLDTIEMRRLHQVERARFIIQYKLATSFHTYNNQQDVSITLRD